MSTITTNRVPVRNLSAGDRISQGVIRNAYIDSRTPKGKRSVIIEYHDGKRVLRYWGSSTTVSVIL